MNDNDVLERVQDAMSAIRMETPVETIIARGRTRRRRRISSLAGAGLTLGLGVLVAMFAFGGAGVVPPSEHSSNPAHLMTYSLVSNADGTATLTLIKGQLPDPNTLQRQLAQAGVPAVVSVGSRCDSQGGDPSGLDQVVTSARLPDGRVALTVTPSAMPQGTELAIAFFPNGQTWNLLARGVPTNCTSAAPTPGPTGPNPVVHP
jgi:hypothetical protein